MHEIEFRCWYDDGYEAKMYRVASIDFNYKRIILNGGETIDFKDGVLMQFTGSYDKNGKKIFEGDIVEFNGEEYVIKYFSKYSRFALSCNDEADRLPMLITMLSYTEVIGNIYERRKTYPGGANV